MYPDHLPKSRVFHKVSCEPARNFVTNPADGLIDKKKLTNTQKRPETFGGDNNTLGLLFFDWTWIFTRPLYEKNCWIVSLVVNLRIIVDHTCISSSFISINLIRNIVEDMSYSVAFIFIM